MENDRDRSLQSWEFLTRFLPRPRFSDFARRFSSSFMRAPLSSTAKAHVLRRAAAGIPTSPVRIDEAYLGGWFAAEPPRRAGPSWRRE